VKRYRVPPNKDFREAFRQRRHFTAALLALPLVGARLLGDARAAPARGIDGAQAPELEAEFWIDADGKPTQFSMLAQRGHWVHLYCWQAGCPGCHSHGFPTLQKIVAAFSDDPRVVNVAVQTAFEQYSVNTAEKVRERQVRYRLPIVMGHDPGDPDSERWPHTMVSYRTGGTPWHVLVDPTGVVVYNGFGLDANKAIAFIRKQLAQA
jgi:hypothetical protein